VEVGKKIFLRKSDFYSASNYIVSIKRSALAKCAIYYIYLYIKVKVKGLGLSAYNKFSVFALNFRARSPKS